MSDLVADWQAKRAASRPKPKRTDDGGGPLWNAQERAALRKMRREAKAGGATLHNDGRGGLPPSRVLGVMRRDEWRCKKCGGNQRLSLHHKSEHMADPKARARSRLLRREGRVDAASNLATICQSCHDAIHQEDRKEHGEQSQQ